MATVDCPSWLKSPGWFPFSRLLREKFGSEVQKLTIDAGFTCPNRDGTKAWGGCSYCSNASFSPAHRHGVTPIDDQVRRALSVYRRKRPDVLGLAYFQAFSNTYAPVGFLQKVYTKALQVDGVVGLCVGTRPDCLSEPALDLLTELAQDVPVFLEMGLESAEDAVLRRANRHCRVSDFEEAIDRLRGRGISLVAHTILGLPGESPEHDQRLVRILNRSGLAGVKIHHLYVAHKTVLARSFRLGELKLQGFSEYLSRVVWILERLSPEVAIQRLVGELSGRYVVAPRWGLSKSQALCRLEAELHRLQTWQGRLWEEFS